MNIQFLSKYRFVLLLLLVSVFGLVSCVGNDQSWAGVTRHGEGEDEIIIVSYKRQVASIAPDKSVNWVYKGRDDTDFYAEAVIKEDRLYIGDFKGRIHAVDLETGEQVWIYEEDRTRILFLTLGSTDRIIAPITPGKVAGEDALFFGNEHGIHALVDLDSEPRIAWTFETDHSVWAQPVYINRSVAVDGFNLSQHQLYVGSLDKNLYSINPDTGKEIWSLDLAGAIVSRPTYDSVRERLYVGTLDSEIYAITLDGERVGRYETTGWVWGSPTIYEDYLYAGDLEGWLYELALTPVDELGSEADTGFSETWKREITEENQALRASPTVYAPVEDRDRPLLLIASEDQYVYALDLFDPDGRAIKWRKELEDRSYSDSVVVKQVEGEGETKELLIVSTYNEDNLLVALRVSDGGQEWVYSYDN